jgi:hypothetical protein
MKQNQDLNNTCILFDKEDEAQQKAIIRFYNDNGWGNKNIEFKGWEDCIGVWMGNLDYYYNVDPLQVIELPSDYYPKTTSHFQLTENNGETKPYVVVDEKGDKGFVTPIVDVSREIADQYQDLFNLLSKEHNLILTISEMDEIIIESKKISNPIVESETISNLPSRKVCFFKLKKGKYLAENGVEITTDMLVKYPHSISSDWSYIILD